MKIVQAEIFDTDMGPSVHDHPVILRLTTDEGITGLGEVGLAYGSGHTAGAGMVENLAENFLIGSDPLRTEQIWDHMFRRSFWALGGGPVVYGAMSAIDTACWDLKGKAFGLPVYQLLGGKSNEHLRAYASQLQFGWRSDFLNLIKPEEYAKLFYDRMKAMRDAVGPNVDIILETHSTLSDTTAIQFGRMCEDLNIFYFEEPSNYVNPKVQKKVAENVHIPMAGGERIYTRWGFRQYFEDQSLDVIQPDMNLCGGMSECKKICEYANVYDITVQLHVCGSPIATAAALHLEASIPNFLIHEHHTNALKDYMKQICVQNYQPVEGELTVPDTPGIGIELNEDFIKDQPCRVVK